MPTPEPHDQPVPPKVSVVIVSWNSAGNLRRCLAALEASRGRENLEIFVVDNGSRDESPRMDSEYPKVTFLRLPRNFGLTRARNIGTRSATGDFVMFLSPAVEVGETTVAELAAQLEARTDAAAVCPVLLDPKGVVATAVYPLPSPSDLYAIWRSGRWPQPGSLPTEPAAVDWVPGNAVLVRTRFIRGMNFLDERLAESWADLELSYQIRRSGRKLVLLPQVTAVVHPPEYEPSKGGARAALAADQALGAAAYVGKHFGWFRGARFRGAVLFASLGGALGSLLRARNLDYSFGLFTSILTGQRIDGSQSSL